MAATPDELSEALRRLKVVQAEDPEVAGITQRTLDRWKKEFREAETLHGCGFVGLLPKSRDRGNRTERFSPAIYELADRVIDEDFLTFKQKGRLPVYAQFREKCLEAGYSAPSYQWFCERIRDLDKYQATLRRSGRRAAYGLERRTSSATATPRTCDRPFERVHIDHTQLDIQLISSTTDRPVGRPWLTLAIDECTRRIFAFYLTFDPPSYRSCMALLREIVRIHNRLPDRLVVDNGKEFSSCDFELLAARYEMTIEKRPPAKARFGSVIERMFGTINTQLLYQLWGNTQATKNDVRTVTKSVDPVRHACWTLGELDQLFREYVYRVYDSAVHPALGMAPAEAFLKAVEKTGLRSTRQVANEESFIVWCLPSTRTGFAKVQPRAGIKVNYLYYWNDDFRSTGIEGGKVRVKVDPFNAGVAYALVKGRWLRCVSEYHHFFNGRSLKEIMIATEELRKLKSASAASKLITAKKLRDFMAAPEEMERIKQQREKDRERQVSERPGEAGLNIVQLETSPQTMTSPPLYMSSPPERQESLASISSFEAIEEAVEL